jgi:hypothetical protein
MPRTPDASTVTTFRRVNATVPTAPVKKSASFDAPIKDGYLIATTRSTQEAQSISWSRSVLKPSIFKSPQFYNGRFFVK